jgi:hypothetical protein
MNLKDKFKKIENREDDPLSPRAVSKIKPALNVIKSEKSTKVRQLDDLLHISDARRKALKALMEALEATRAVYSPKEKILINEPDHRVRAAAAVDILCFTDGKPVERREIVQINVDGNEDAQRKILESPAMRAALKAKIEEADRAKLAAGEVEQNKGNG